MNVKMIVNKEALGMVNGGKHGEPSPSVFEQKQELRRRVVWIPSPASGQPGGLGGALPTKRIL